MYKFSKTSKFVKSVKKLPKNAKENLKNKLLFMENDPFHPSLRSKKNITASVKFSDTVYESSINIK